MTFTKRGLPDDYDIVREFLATALHDDAELAIRLGAPVSLNRQGNVIYHNSFDCGLGLLYPNTSGTGSKVELSNAAPRSKGVSVYLTAGPLTNNYARLVCGIRLPDTLSMGVEFAIAVLDSSAQLTLTTAVYDGVHVGNYGVKVVCGTGAAYVYNALGAWEAISNVPVLETGWGIYHQVKLVIDNGILGYRRLIVDETQIDLSGYAPYVSASVNVKLVQFTIEFLTLAGASPTALLDDVLVTLNEI